MPLPPLRPDVPNYSTPHGAPESEFRYEVRTALGMDIFTRDDQILDEIKRLKHVEQESWV